MLNYPSQSICLGKLAARNYLQLHLLVALCLLVVGICRPPLPLAPRATKRTRTSWLRRSWPACRAPSSSFLLPSFLSRDSHTTIYLLISRASSRPTSRTATRSLARSVCGRGASSGHRVDVSIGFGHVVVSLCPQHASWGVPDKNGAF